MSSSPPEARLQDRLKVWKTGCRSSLTEVAERVLQLVYELDKVTVHDELGRDWLEALYRWNSAAD